MCDYYQSLTKPPSNYWDSWRGAFSEWPLFSSSEPPLNICVYWQAAMLACGSAEKEGKILEKLWGSLFCLVVLADRSCHFWCSSGPNMCRNTSKVTFLIELLCPFVGFLPLRLVQVSQSFLFLLIFTECFLLIREVYQAYFTSAFLDSTFRTYKHLKSAKL